MYIADNNVYGVDLNPVAVELAEVSLWLNTIHEGAFVPWFGMQLVCGNSLVGARRQVFHRKPAQQEAKNRSALAGCGSGKGDAGHGTKRRYGLSLPAAGQRHGQTTMTKSSNRWRGKKSRPSPSGARSLPSLFQTVKSSTSKHFPPQWISSGKVISKCNAIFIAAPLIRFKYSVKRKPGINASPRPPKRKTESIDQEMFSRNVRNSSPYRRLKLIMDYWCALWFWPIEKADLLPGRAEFLFDLTLILEGNLYDASVDEKGQQPLFPDTRPKQMSLNMLDELGYVNVTSCAKKIPGSVWCRNWLKDTAICTGSLSLRICLRGAADLIWCWAIRPGSRWNGTKAASWVTPSRSLYCAILPHQHLLKNVKRHWKNMPLKAHIWRLLRRPTLLRIFSMPYKIIPC